MKRIHRKCSNSYQHYFVQTAVSLREVLEGPSPYWQREITLECSRCQYVLWVDSVIRTHTQLPQVWRGS